jgi:hypothetical protein
MPGPGRVVRKSVVQVFAGKAPPAAHTGRICKGGNTAGGRRAAELRAQPFLTRHQASGRQQDALDSNDALSASMVAARSPIVLHLTS